MRKLMFAVSALILSAAMAVAQELNLTHENLGHLLPQPRSVELTSGGFVLSGSVAVSGQDQFAGIESSIDRFITAAGLSKEAGGSTITITKVDAITGTEDHNVPEFDNEAYKLTISSGAIAIEAVTRIGVIRAMQTLEQLLQDYPTELPGAVIVDWPAFKVRGFMHDIGRSYISVEELKQEIDLLTRFKVNVFQWHLTDKHGFRFQSLVHPKVNTNFTPTRSDKYYTQAECKEIQNYAWERGMTIIPEIDMPGHSARFEGAMGFTMASDQGKAALKEILDEVIATFDKSPYIHIGGDETAEATKEYINEMADYIKGKSDRKVMTWNPWGAGQSNLIDPATMHVDMCTNWATAGRKVTGIPNIDMRYNYINHFDMFGDLAGIYRSNILYEQKGTADVAGTITGIWNDRLISDEKLIIKENNFYANTIASAERAWKGGGKQYIEAGGAYLPNSGDEYDEFKDWEERFIYHKATTLKSVEDMIPYVRQTHMRWNLSKSYSNNGTGATKFDIEDEEELTPQAGEKTVTGAGVWLNHIWAGTIAGVLGKTAQSKGQTRYAWTYVCSPSEQTVGLQFQTYDYSRSDRGAAPENGKWDMMGSQIWINDTEILPAADWTTAGSTEEDELGNVNFTARAPIPVTLKQGWNKVLIKLPYVSSTPNRGNKWQFTCFFTDLEGINAVEGLLYNPNKSDTDEYQDIIPYPPLEISTDKVYTFKCMRQNRYVTSSGVGGKVKGITTLTPNTAYWYFEQREDGKYNLVNFNDGGMIDGSVANNTALITSKTVPGAGWETKPAATDGYYIFVSGTSQFNQQNKDEYNVLNWGGGANTTDDGCHYLIEEVEGLTPADAIFKQEPGESGEVTELSKAVIALGSDTGKQGSTTDAYNATNITTTTWTLSNGNAITITPSSGKVWSGATDGGIYGSWTNTAALDDLNTDLSTTFEASDLSAGSTLYYTASGNASSTSTITLAFAGKEKSGDDILIYATLAARSADLDNFAVSGLTDAQVLYATNDGTGWSNTAAFSQGYDANLSAITMVKVTGKLTSDKTVVLSSTTAKNGWQIVAYKVEGPDSGASQPGEDDIIVKITSGDNSNDQANVKSIGFTVPTTDVKDKPFTSATLWNINIFTKADNGATNSYLVLSTSTNIADKVAVSTNNPTPAGSFAEYTFENTSIEAGKTYYMLFASDAAGTTQVNQRVAISSTNGSGQMVVDGNGTARSNWIPYYIVNNVPVPETLDFFNESVDDIQHWVRISNVRNNNYCLYADDQAGLHSHQTAAVEGESFALIGDQNSFTIYSKVKQTYFGSDNANSGTAVVAKTPGTTYKLISQAEDGVYVIAPTSAESVSFNMFGGAGNDIKYYAASDGGSTWRIAELGGTLTIRGMVDGNILPINNKVGVISITANGSSSNVKFNLNGRTEPGELETVTITVPKAKQWTIAEGQGYSGYDCTLAFNGETKEQIVLDELPQESEVITATFTANDKQNLFYSIGHGRPYRIPAIAKAKNGDLIAISDDRFCGADIGYGRVDLVYKVSHDNGMTWSENDLILAQGDGNNESKTCGYGDAAICADRTSDKVMVMAVSAPNGGTCWTAAQRGVITWGTLQDDGTWKWEVPVDIKDELMALLPTDRINYFVGSGKISQSRIVKKGDYYRVYVALWTTGADGLTNYVIYSDEFGKPGSWQLLGSKSVRPVPGGDEPKAEELPDGRVVVSGRKSYGRYYNIFKFKDETYTTGYWGTAVASHSVDGGLSWGGNSTNGEIMVVKAKNRTTNAETHIVLQSAPAGNDRSLVSIWYKLLDNSNKYATPTAFSQNWTKGMQVSDFGSAYSTMCVQADGKIAFFFEDSKSGAGYDMVYQPIALSQLAGLEDYEIVMEEEDDDTAVTDIISTRPTDLQGKHIYTLMGVRQSHPTKGVNIVDGVKVIVK